MLRLNQPVESLAMSGTRRADSAGPLAEEDIMGTKQQGRSWWAWLVFAACIALPLAGSWAVYACRPTAPTVPIGGPIDVVEEEAMVPAAIVEPAGIEVEIPKVDEEPAEPVVPEVEEDAKAEEVSTEQAEPVSKLAICLAGAYVLNPEWDLSQCDRMRAGDDGRQSRCREQRAPLVEFAEKLCATIVEETDREGIDLLVPGSVIERESSGGRVQYDRRAQSYYVSTSICEMTLTPERIISREPSTRRPGAEVMVWTYGDDLRQNRQTVRVVEETAEGVRINTCAAGEEGIMQTVPREWRRGTAVEATGEVLDGSTTERRERVAGDPVLQIRLGVQALAEHRELCPEDRRVFFGDWIAAYNLGSCDPSNDHGQAYACKIMRNYQRQCLEGYVTLDGEVVPRRVEDVWEPCRDAAEAYAARCRDV